MSETEKNGLWPFDPCANDIERTAMRFARGWHRHPSLDESLFCEGVPLGEAVEYGVFREVLAALVRRKGDDTS